MKMMNYKKNITILEIDSEIILRKNLIANPSTSEKQNSVL